MLPSLDGTLPELICDITREQLSIDFVHRILQFLSFFEYQ